MREGAGGVEFLDATSTGKEPVSREGGEETTTLGSKLGGNELPVSGGRPALSAAIVARGAPSFSDSVVRSNDGRARWDRIRRRIFRRDFSLTAYWTLLFNGGITLPSLTALRSSASIGSRVTARLPYDAVGGGSAAT